MQIHFTAVFNYTAVHFFFSVFITKGEYEEVDRGCMENSIQLFLNFK